MKRRIRVSATVGLLLAVYVMTSAFTCTPSQQTQASKFADAYAQSLKSIHDAVDSALVSEKIDPAEQQGAYKALLRANEAGLHLNSAIRGVANSQGSIVAVQAAIDEASKAIDDGTAAIKNPDTKAIVTALASSAKTILGQIAAAYKTGGTQ
jgi:hypothetical protein